MKKRYRQAIRGTSHLVESRGFTLIELFVVISIIAVLMGILMPSLRKAKEQARKVACRSNMRQIAVAVSLYQATYNFDFTLNNRWYYKNGTADHAHEWQPSFAEDLMSNKQLPNREIFFCPSVRNLAYDKNYRYQEIRNHVLKPYDTQYIEDNFDNDTPVFWSTHHWIWKKRVTNDTPTVNNTSSGAMLCDMSPGAWEWVGINNDLGYNFVEVLGIEQKVEHYNVLMKDMSVVNPSDLDVPVNQWLWNADKWPGVQ